MRREGAGLLLGIGRRDDAPSFDTHLDLRLTEPLVERAVHRAPALADASLMRGWAGLYEMTPDQTGILSAVPEVEGLHVIAGFSGHGFMHGPIAGRLMGELIADGRATTVDIAPLPSAASRAVSWPSSRSPSRDRVPHRRPATGARHPPMDAGRIRSAHRSGHPR